MSVALFVLHVNTLILLITDAIVNYFLQDTSTAFPLDFTSYALLSFCALYPNLQSTLSGTGRSPAASLSEFTSTFRWSCGAGIVVPTAVGRFEANYCVILASQEHDRVRRGLQLGFAASSL